MPVKNKGSKPTEVDHSDLSSVLDFFWKQKKKGLHTAIPGVIESYDAATRRAVVMPALRRVMNTGEEKNRARLVNVPVVFPSTARAIVHLQLEKGDAVLLIFSERGTTEFRKTHKVSTPDVGRYLSAADAMAIPGFGTPPETAGAYAHGNFKVALATTTGELVGIDAVGNVMMKKGASSMAIGINQVSINTKNSLQFVDQNGHVLFNLEDGYISMTGVVRVNGRRVLTEP